jgi:hypothetical protein
MAAASPDCPPSIVGIGNCCVAPDPADLGAPGDGGGIVQNSSTVSENEVTFDGAGILNHGTAIVSSSTVSGNIGSGTGGGIRNSGGVVTLTSSTVSGNQNGTGGGIYNTGTVNLSSSVITGNTPDNCVGVPGC